MLQSLISLFYGFIDKNYHFENEKGYLPLKFLDILTPKK